MKPVRSRTPFKKTPSKQRSSGRDPVKVYCRIRPMQNDNDVSCMAVISPSTVRLVPPESSVNYRSGTYKELQYTFKFVFDETSTQKFVFDTVALPLVENLIQGKNGLLFTYGVTGSGKTFTMTGDMTNGGIMPRCLDVLFNSISEFQAKKYCFKPDKMNGFDVQTDADALLDRQSEMLQMLQSKTPKTPRRKEPNYIEEQRVSDSTKLTCAEEDNTYAVFVTYIEIYNNNTYDLLEEIPEDCLRQRALQSRIIREDANHNMYVHGVTEVEVKSTEEAFDLFYKGQKRKRMAHTSLNAESSRSHSVFTIRLVQAPLDGQGETVLQDKRAVCISQLSLVDLAGSERTNRTKNSGQRLREAGNINNSLMTLRSCLEILRENQMQGTNKMVPYRDSRITHLFKNYFDGEGQVAVIVCVNPRADDYDETVQVMKFAEMTQEVQVTRPEAPKIEIGLLPGRRKANQIFKQAVQHLEQNEKKEDVQNDFDIGLVYSLGPPFPSMEMNSADAENILRELILHLELRMKKRCELLADLPKRQGRFRCNLLEMEKENCSLKQEVSTYKATLDQERKKMSVLETKLTTMESHMATMQKNLDEKELTINMLKQELDNKEVMLNKRTIEKEKVKQKYSSKMMAETEKMSKEMQQQLKLQKAELKNQMREKEEKLRKVKQILIEDRPSPQLLSANSDSHISLNNFKSDHNVVSATTSMTPYSSKLKSTGTTCSGLTPVRRRSRSVGGLCGEVWLDHRPAIPAPLGTVLQPHMKKRKSVTRLTDIKDITDPMTNKYCLMTQEQDSGGDVETRLYKGDVVPTVSGGAQVIFNDVETLRQESPSSSPVRKRNLEAETHPQDLATICAMSVEGHAKKPRL
ncbi:kinesin-like protein KIF23 [Schistocerca cancellata]|uniref:kinesin-like protein KIF23 n=1 Tax=Schistocerca cancellata TaxID=274614 RepID=UPI0021181755|nr:kinesin-like protein KIF23 [Schistocerca cancellata]